MLTDIGKVEKVEVSRSYSRKVKSGDQYEMMDVFSSMKADMLPGSTPEEIARVSDDIYRQCVEDVELAIAVHREGEVTGSTKEAMQIINRLRKALLEKEEIIKTLKK